MGDNSTGEEWKQERYFSGTTLLDLATYTGQVDILWAVDVETNGLDTHKGKPITIAGCSDKGNTFFIDLRNRSDVEDAWLNFLLTNRACVFHNAKFDIKMLQNIGMHVNTFEDTYLMAYLINEYEVDKSLDNLAIKYVGLGKYGQELEIWKSTHSKEFKTNGLETCPVKIIKPYNIADTIATLKLYFALRGKMNSLGLLPQLEVEKKLLRVLINLERRGVKIDVKYGLESLDRIQSEIDPLDRKIKSVYHVDNLRSPKQVLAALRSTGLQVTSTNKETLADLAANGNQVADDLITYRKKSKLCSTYIIPILTKCDPNTHRLHATYNQCITKTHRLSSSDPNLQNIPKPSEDKYQFSVARRMFITDDHFGLIGADYDQEEMRLIADECNCTGLLELFKSGKRDVYIEIAKVIWPQKDIDKRLRYIAKQNVLGCSYGMGATKFCIQSKRYGITIGLDEAVYVIGVVNERFPEIKETLYRLSSLVRRQGFVTDRFGMRYNVPGELSYKGLNAVIQGTAAQVMKRAAIEIDKISSPNWGMINTIHDEFLVEFDTRDYQVTDSKRMLKEAMESVSSHFKLPITASVKEYNENWASPVSN